MSETVYEGETRLRESRAGCFEKVPRSCVNAVVVCRAWRLWAIVMKTFFCKVKIVCCIYRTPPTT